MDMKTETMVSMRMPVEFRDQLRALASSHDRSVSGELRAAVRAHLERSDQVAISVPLRLANPDERRGHAAPAVPLGAEGP